MTLIKTFTLFIVKFLHSLFVQGICFKILSIICNFVFSLQVEVIFDFLIKKYPRLTSFTHPFYLVHKFQILRSLCLLDPNNVTIWLKKVPLVSSQCHFWLFRQELSPDYKFGVFNKFSSHVFDFAPILPFGSKWRH